MFIGIFKRNKSFVFLWLAQIFSQLAINILNFSLALIIYNQTKSNFSVALLIIMYGAPAFLFGILAGVLVDKWDRKKTMLTVNLLRFITILVFMIISQNITATLIFAFTMALFTQFFFPAEGALIPQIIRKEDLLEANSFYSLTYYFSMVCGYALAGPLLGAFGANRLYILVAIFMYMAFLSIYFMPFNNMPRSAIFYNFFKFLGLINTSIVFTLKQSIKEVIRDLIEAYKYVSNNEKVKYSFILMLFSQVMVGVALALIPGYGVEALGLKVSETSLYLIGPAAFGMVIGPVFLAKFSKKVTDINLFNTIGVLGGSISFFALAGIKRIPEKYLVYSFGLLDRFGVKNLSIAFDYLILAIIVMLFIGFFNSLINVVSNTCVQENTKDSYRGRLYGFLQTIVTAAGLFPVLLGGVGADLLGVNKVFMILGIMLLPLYFYTASHKLK